MRVFLERNYNFLVNWNLQDLKLPQHLAQHIYAPFHGMVGAIDGTHVRVIVPSANEQAFRSYKHNEITVNVLLVCNFDMLFTFAHVGVEGSAHDSFVLDHAINNAGFSIPNGSFLLGDAGYSCWSHRLLTPYRGVRYHLQEWMAAPAGPQNMQELFNFLHSKLRNVLERGNAVLKRRFGVLRAPLEHDMLTKWHTIYSCIALHNFIRLFDRGDPLFDEFEHDNVYVAAADHAGEAMAQENGNAWRNEIAQALWDGF